MDVLLTSRQALPCDGRGVISDAGVLIREGRIVAVGARSDIENGLCPARSVERVDFGEAAMLPGLVNAHAHLEYTHLGPLRERRRFVPWISEVTAWNQRTPASFRLDSAKAGARAMLSAGITCVGEFVNRGQGLRAILDSGLHGTAFWEFFGGYGGDPALRLAQLRQRVEDARAQVQHSGQRGVGVGVAPHAPYTVSLDALRAVTRLAADVDCPVATHLAESTPELEFLRDGTGELADHMGATLGLPGPLHPTRPPGNPIRYASEGGLLDTGPGRSLLVHATQLSEAEVTELSTRHTAVALCPRSNDHLHTGACAPVAALAATGVPLAVGTDSLGSNATLDLFAELRALRRIWLEQEPAVDPETVADRLISMATSEGAAALGLHHELGSLTAGKRADIVVIDPPTRHRALTRGVLDELQASDVVATFTDGALRHHRGQAQ